MVVKASEDPFSTADMRFPGPNGMSADASALLFRNGTHVALRIECSDGNLEFTDNAYIGTDPNGKLYWKDENDFGRDQNKRCEYIVQSVEYNNNKYCRVRFWNKDTGSSTKPFAEFVARDDQNTVFHTKVDDHSYHGVWTSLELNTARATVQKASGQDIITLTTGTRGAWGISANWKIPVSITTLRSLSINVKGTLYYKQPSDLKDGNFVNYNNDRLVFYRSALLAKDFTAYFIPLEIRQGKLGSDDTLEMPGVTGWPQV